MAKTKRRKRRVLWSVPRIRDPRHAGLTVRVTELRRGGTLNVVWMENGRQVMRSLRCTRADLGATGDDPESRARVLACTFIEELAKRPATGPDGRAFPLPKGAAVAEAGVLTVGRIVDLYEQGGCGTAQPRYHTEQVARVRKFANFVGLDRPVISLGQNEVDAWVRHRREQGVRQGTIAGDIDAVKIGINRVGERKRADGSLLLEVSPLARVRVEKERNPRRPRADAARYKTLCDVSAQLPPTFRLALDLVQATGHRIGAVRKLRQEDVYLAPKAAAAKATELDSEFGWCDDDFPNGGLRFYAGERSTNKAYDHIAPIDSLAREALERARVTAHSLSPWLLASPKDPARPVDYHTLKQWMRRAEELAGVPHLTGGIWHPFRRGWATARKHYPAQDLAKLGGWRDVATMQKSYQQADGRTIRTIVSGG